MIEKRESSGRVLGDGLWLKSTDFIQMLAPEQRTLRSPSYLCVPGLCRSRNSRRRLKDLRPAGCRKLAVLERKPHRGN